MKRPLILLVACAAVGLLLLSAQPASAQVGVSIGYGGVSVGVGHGHVSHGYVPYRSHYSSYSSHYGHGHYTTRRYVQPRIVVPQYHYRSYNNYHYRPPCIQHHSYGYGQGYGGGGFHYRH